MEVYRTKDGQVSKFVHDDGSETTIKTVSSCGNIVNKLTGAVEPVEVEREKFSVFVSSSVGCPVGCKFCYLTAKKFPYHKLSPNEIIQNVQEALNEEIKFKPEIRKKYLKLAWMGMGDVFFMPAESVRNMTKRILEWSIGDKGFAKGLDGVDIGTSYPGTNHGWPHHFSKLNDELIGRFESNPNNNYMSAVRLFYSLHGLHQRNRLVPLHRFNSPVSDLQMLAKFKEWYGIDVILHYMFLKGVNDSEKDLRNLELIYRNIVGDMEFRFLRFNRCDDSEFEESPNFDELIKWCSKHLGRIKYQTSVGSEVSAACGQFLCKPLDKLK